MSFDFFQDESARIMDKAALHPSLQPEPGIWGGFFPGAAQLTMEGFAKTARAIDLLGAVGPIVQDKLTGDTTYQDQYFKEHDALFNKAVDYWTPSPGSVGTAGRIAGSIIPTLAKVIVSPALAVGSEQLATGEDLVRQGVDAGKAQAVGAIQGTGLGLGIWAPIFGNTLATRALVAGAGANVAQGIITKAASRAILKGDKAAEQYNPWDAEGLAIDALMGIAFGGLYHLGAKHAEDIKKNLTPTDEAAILTANQARHLEDTTAPGRPADAPSATSHVAAVKKAVDDILNDRSVNVEQIVQDAKFLPDVTREQAAAEVHAELSRQARATVLEAMAAEQARVAAADKPGFQRTPEDLIALRESPEFKGNADVARAIEIAKKPGALRTAEDRIFLESVLKERAFQDATKPIEPLVRDPKPIEAPTRAAAEPGKSQAEAVPVDPLITEARQRIAEHGEVTVKVGEDANGQPVTRKVSELMDEASKGVEQAKADANLFTVAASCMLGAL